MGNRLTFNRLCPIAQTLLIHEPADRLESLKRNQESTPDRSTHRTGELAHAVRLFPIRTQLAGTSVEAVTKGGRYTATCNSWQSVRVNFASTSVLVPLVSSTGTWYSYEYHVISIPGITYIRDKLPSTLLSSSGVLALVRRTLVPYSVPVQHTDKHENMRT